MRAGGIAAKTARTAPPVVKAQLSFDELDRLGPATPQRWNVGVQYAAYAKWTVEVLPSRVCIDGSTQWCKDSAMSRARFGDEYETRAHGTLCGRISAFI